ncbi:hypothetical protein AAG906_019198 [Vitis piasezkii]
MSRLMNDFNSLKNNILNNGKWNKPNQKPRSQPSSSKSPLMIKQSFFTFLEDYNSVIVTFGDRSLADVKDKESISISRCPKLDGVLYVDKLKTNLLSIGQICDKDNRMNFYQELCKVVNKEGKVIIIGHRTVDNCYAINPNSRTSLVCSKAKVDHTKL